MGQVFSYPAGEKHPVQLQMRNLDKSEPDMTFSEPMDPQKLPQTELPPPPRKPRWYHRVFSFGGNRRLCLEYDRYMAEKARQPELAKACAEAVQKTYGDKRITTSLNAEKQEAKYLRESLVENMKNKVLQKNMDLLKQEQGKVPDGIDVAVSVYGPVPKERADLRDKRCIPGSNLTC